METGMKEFAMQDSESALLMLQNMHATFKFRHQHWGMVKKYIIDNTKYPKATGGTPITTWLPNQIGACLE
jgi:indoleamine 2,3-dioxygenase